MLRADFRGGTGCALRSGVRLASWLSLVVFSACGPTAAIDDVGPADSGLAPDGGAFDTGADDSGTPDSGPAQCALVGLPAELALTEGGRGTITWTVEGSSPVVTADGPQGFEIELSPDQRSLAVHAPYAIDGRFELSLHLRCGAAAAEATTSIVVRRLEFSAVAAWSPGVSGPDEREHPMIFIDGADPDRLFLYGGYSFDPVQYTMVTDLWAFDLASETWSTVSSASPAARAGGRLFAFPDRAEAIYAGGADLQNNAQLAFDRVVITGTVAQWSSIPITADAQALPTQLGSLIYDAPRERLLSVCGVTDTDVHCQIGALGMDGRYQVLAPAPGDRPSPRYGFFAAHDKEQQRLVIFSGAQYPTQTNPVNPAQDTWALHLGEDPLRWEKLLDADPAVPGRRNGCSAFDPIGKRLFVWGGTADARTTMPGLYVLDLGGPTASFTKVEITLLRPIRSSCSAVYDPARRRILFGFGNNSVGIYADFVALSL